MMLTLVQELVAWTNRIVVMVKVRRGIIAVSSKSIEPSILQSEEFPIFLKRNQISNH